MSAPRTEPKLPRSLHLALFAIGLLWLLASRVGAENAAQGIAGLLHADVFRPLLYELFLLILLIGGFTALNWLAAREGSIRATNALPTRATAPREWQKGTALGWAIALLAIAPGATLGALHPQFWFSPRAVGLTILSLLVVFLGSIATEIAFRGFLFRRLIDATGPSLATLLLSALFAVVSTSRWNTTPYSFPVNFLAGLLFSMAYLRTHALWLGWGVRFGWQAATAVLFGLPLAGSLTAPGIVATDVSGPLWLTGGAYGPEGALLTVVALSLGTIALHRITRDYAWDYTQPTIVPGGYPMDVPPPAAHTSMEAAAAVPLVQILGATSTHASTLPVITQHLQGGSIVPGAEPSPVVQAEQSTSVGGSETEGEAGFRHTEVADHEPRIP